MKLLVTGGAGFIGSAVVRLAINRGHTVLNIDKLTYAANLDNVKSVADSKQYAFEKVDIVDRHRIQDLLFSFRPDGIIHLAAESHVDRSIDGPGEFISTNVNGTYSLLEATRSYLSKTGTKTNGFKFLHVSTDEVYGDLGPQDPAFTESTSYRPSSPYSASKAASDHLARAWQRTYDLPVIITNCSNNYGPFQYPEKLIPVVISKALEREPIPIYGSGENIRDWLYVNDHADALLTVIEKGAPGETYNIGGNSERTNLSLIEELCTLMSSVLNDGFDYKGLMSFVTDRPGHDRRYAINGDKIASELGWSPKTSLYDGLRETLNWYLSNQDWWRPVVSAPGGNIRLGTVEPKK